MMLSLFLDIATLRGTFRFQWATFGPTSNGLAMSDLIDILIDSDWAAGLYGSVAQLPKFHRPGFGSSSSSGAFGRVSCANPCT